MLRSKYKLVQKQLSRLEKQVLSIKEHFQVFNLSLSVFLSFSHFVDKCQGFERDGRRRAGAAGLHLFFFFFLQLFVSLFSCFSTLGPFSSTHMSDQELVFTLKQRLDELEHALESRAAFKPTPTHTHQVQ